jgi:hypothetical protein
MTARVGKEIPDSQPLGPRFIKAPAKEAAKVPEVVLSRSDSAHTSSNVLQSLHYFSPCHSGHPFYRFSVERGTSHPRGITVVLVNERIGCKFALY